METNSLPSNTTPAADSLAATDRLPPSISREEFHRRHERTQQNAPPIRLTVGDYDPVLAYGCLNCDGLGLLTLLPGGFHQESCPACNGTGYVPTENGKALLKFARLFAGKGD